MAAGLGFKTFTTGEVLTAGDVNGYLMQGINVFASEAARNAAITSPQEGQFAFTKDNNSLWYYTGSAWAASGATGDIEGVTAGVGISGGGTSGTVTITNSMATAITTAGDLIKGTGSGTFDRLGIGTTGQVLTVSGGAPVWTTPAGGGGKVLQVVSATNSTEKSIASTSFTDSNLTITITPTLNTSKVMILISQNIYISSGSAQYSSAGYRLMRDSTPVIDYSGLYDQSFGIYAETLSSPKNATWVGYAPVTFLDSPATTSATTYKTQIKMSSTADSRFTAAQQAGSTSSIIALEIGA
jgi:hypothetical protein